MTVSQLTPTITPAGGTWGKFVQGGGTASIVNLSGQGGNLENNQPLPTGAGFLTTGASDSDRAEVGISADFGDASTVLNNLAASYSYYKVDNGPNVFAAPSLKLSILSLTGTGDNFGQLIYEPTWNQVGAGSQASPTDAWQTVSIGSATGSGSTNEGGWWWSGGFEQPSGAGGPPIRSAAEWATLFSNDADFASARIVGINIGVGTYNQNQIGYFDNVEFGTVGDTMVWNFDTAAVPEPMSFLVFLGLGVGGALGGRRKLRKSASQ